MKCVKVHDPSLRFPAWVIPVWATAPCIYVRRPQIPPCRNYQLTRCKVLKEEVSGQSTLLIPEKIKPDTFQKRPSSFLFSPGETSDARYRKPRGIYRPSLTK